MVIKATNLQQLRALFNQMFHPIFFGHLGMACRSHDDLHAYTFCLNQYLLFWGYPSSLLIKNIFLDPTMSPNPLMIPAAGSPPTIYILSSNSATHYFLSTNLQTSNRSSLKSSSVLVSSPSPKISSLATELSISPIHNPTSLNTNLSYPNTTLTGYKFPILVYKLQWSECYAFFIG